MSEIIDAIETYQSYRECACLFLGISMLGMLRRLQFHPNIAIIGETIRYAAHELVHFFSVAFAVIVFYAIAGYILFRYESSSYHMYATIRIQPPQY
jgi:hypothetical protein